MPERISSKGKSRKTQCLGRELHWYGNDDPHRGKCHEDEIQAIVKAVGVPLRTSNTILSRKELSYDIGIAETLYWTAIDVRDFGRTKKHLGLIYKSAARLKKLLNNEEAWKSIAPHVPLLFEVGSDKKTFSSNSLDVLLCATEKALASVSNSQQVLKEDRPSEIVIAQLMKVFEKHFAAQVITSRPKGEKNQTPYLRFVKIVLRKTGLPDYDDDNETIIRATSKARKAKRVQAA